METRERIQTTYDPAEWESLETLLFCLGVNWSYRGFGLALEAALMLKRDNSLKSCMKIIYIDVAKKNRTGGENVRRDITTLARVIWRDGNRERLEEMAGKRSDRPPTCREFIGILADLNL
ncbi:MAG: hypothetical protein HFI93_00140 [Lachnospiraceae bacterium]|nr:hypothetical protein [Lachnospiraceae bacterium]